MAFSFGRILIVFSTAASAAALLATTWIIIPAFSYEIWLLSVLASEWSLGFGALALAGVLSALAARQASGGGRLWKFSAALGGLAILLSLYPLADAVRLAREQNTTLSFGQYLSGFVSAGNSRATNSTGQNFTTHNFFVEGDTTLQLDAHLPAEANGAGVIVVHGGSWRSGGRGDFPLWNRWLTENGYAVFDVDYRLAPQPNWRTATGDVKCAVAWVKRHAAEFKISPDRLAIWGRSAGGHLALLAAYSADDARLPSSCPNIETVTGGDVRAVISFYAPTDLIYGYDHPANRRVLDGRETLRAFLGGGYDESEEMRARFTLASPVAHVSANTPPTFLVHGGQDQLVRREHAARLGDRLKQANVPHKILQIGCAQHGFDYNFNGWGAQIVQPLLLDFLRENTAPR